MILLKILRSVLNLNFIYIFDSFDLGLKQITHCSGLCVTVLCEIGKYKEVLHPEDRRVQQRVRHRGIQ